MSIALDQPAPTRGASLGAWLKRRAAPLIVLGLWLVRKPLRAAVMGVREAVRPAASA